jgi:hypothetical protein
MDVETADVHQTLEYRRDTAIIKLLPIGLGLCLLGVFPFALDDSPELENVIAGCVVLAAGIALSGFALWRRWHLGRPLFVLSPMGIHYQLNPAKKVLVPWREIHAVDTIDITTWNWSLRNPGTQTFRDVTVVLVSKQFYDAHIFINSFLWRGPLWGVFFIPKGSFIQVALHHEIVSAEPRALREAVEARWRAFRGQPPDKSAEPAGRHIPAIAIDGSANTARTDPPPGIKAGAKPVLSWWAVVANVVFLIGIAVALTNLLGLWATAGQIAAREERRKWAEEEKQRDEEMRKFQENVQEQQRRMEKMWEEFHRRF